MRRTTLATGLLAAVLSISLAGVVVVAQEETERFSTGTGAAWFTGRGTGAPIFFDPEVEVEPGQWFKARGAELHGVTIESTDPRFTGEWSVTVNADEYPIWLGEREEVVHLERDTVRLQNPEGSWLGTGTIVERREDGELTDDEGMWILEGEGAFENLTAYVLVDFLEAPGEDEILIRGAILPAPPTDFPDPPSTVSEAEGTP